MFRTSPAADPPPLESEAASDSLVPLSVLALDLAAPDAGWAAHLADRGISITIDDIGRASVTRTDARQLFDEKRDREAQVREHAAAVERQAIEADRQWRAALAGGLPAYAIPHGVTPAAAMLEAAHDAQPRRQSLVEEAFSNPGETTFHPMPDGDDW